MKRQESVISELRQQVAVARAASPARPQATAHPLALGGAFNVGEKLLDGLFAFVVVWAAAALLFACAWRVVKAVFGGG